MISKCCLGMEIAGRDLSAAVVHARLGKMRLLQTFEIPGFLDLEPAAQKAAVANAVEKNRHVAGEVFLTIPREYGIIRQLEFPVEVWDKLRDAITLQIETLSPWPVADVHWDFSAVPPAKGTRTLRVTVLIIPRATLDPFIELFRTLKLPLSGVSLSAAAAAHGVRTLWNDGTPTVVLDCRHGIVDAGFVHESHAAFVTQPGDDTTEAAKSALNKLGSMARNGIPEDVRFIAHGAAAQSLESFERQRLPLENATADSSDHFGSIAAALLGVRKTAFGANLLPPDLRYRRSRLHLVPTYVLVALAALLGLAMLLREPYQFTAYASQLDAEIQAVASDVTDVASQEAELNMLSERYRTLGAHLQNGDRNLEALRELARVLTADTWLSNYNFQEGTVTISGFATSAATVQKALEDSPLFRDVQSTAAVTRESNGKDRFSFRAAIEVMP